MSAEAINQLYIDVYGRPASQEEISYHANRFGSELDEIESQALRGEMTSVPGYTPRLTEFTEAQKKVTAEAGDDGTPPSQPPDAPAEASDPVYQTYRQVLARDPEQAGLDYYRNVRPDLIRDPRAFRQAAIQGGEFGGRLRDLYRQNMGYDPSQQSFQQLMSSGTNLNPYELRGAIARQNIAMRPRYADYGYNPYSQNFMNQYQPQPMQYQPPTPPMPYQPFGIGGKGGQPMRQPAPMGGGKGGGPGGTIGMGTASAGIGGKR
tara:strand:+ start:1273 stop:2061 length:789 start_codon:yes stop_codon:yes gene_type:complete